MKHRLWVIAAIFSTLTPSLRAQSPGKEFEASPLVGHLFGGRIEDIHAPSSGRISVAGRPDLRISAGLQLAKRSRARHSVVSGRHAPAHHSAGNLLCPHPIELLPRRIDLQLHADSNPAVRQPRTGRGRDVARARSEPPVRTPLRRGIHRNGRGRREGLRDALARTPGRGSRIRLEARRLPLRNLSGRIRGHHGVPVQELARQHRRRRRAGLRLLSFAPPSREFHPGGASCARRF